MERVFYTIFINGKRFLSTYPYVKAFCLIEFLKACGCKDKIEIEAELGGELK